MKSAWRLREAGGDPPGATRAGSCYSYPRLLPCF